MRILVGGETRKCGKTSLVCRILEWFPERRWLAVKVTSHRHAAAHPTGGDTARYRAAGAAEAILIEAAGEEAARQLEDAARGWPAVCVEGTGVAAWMEADVRLLVRSGPGEAVKPEAREEVFRPDATVGPNPGDFAPDGEPLREFLRMRWKEE